MRIAYLDCFSGVSGDMLLGAFIDAGLPVDSLRAELAALHLGGYGLKVERVVCGGIAGQRVVVTNGEAASHAPSLRSGRTSRHIDISKQGGTDAPLDLLGVVRGSTLAKPVKDASLSVLQRLLEAESRVHNGTSQARFTEQYRLGTLIEVVGTILGLHLLGIERVECSPLNVGGGTIRSANGLRPALAPSAADILCAASVPVYGSASDCELVDTTGAALLATLTSAFGPLPAMKMEACGYGMSKTKGAAEPRAIRILVGDAIARTASPGVPAVVEAVGPALPAPVDVEGHQQIGRHRQLPIAG